MRTFHETSPAVRSSDRVGAYAHTALISAAVLASAVAGILLSRQTELVAAIWFSNAILAWALIRRPWSHWPGLLAGAAIAFLAANALTGSDLTVSAGLTVCNLVEAAILAGLVRRLGDDLDLSQPRTLAWFCAISFGPPTILSALGGAGVLHLMADAPFLDVAAVWYPADVLGILILLPFLLSLRREEIVRLFAQDRRGRTLGLLGAVLGVSAIVFSQDSYPLLFLVGLPLVFASLKLGVAATAASIIGVGAIALTATVQGMGPVALADGDLQHQILVLQSFLAATSLMVLPVASVLADQRRLIEAVEEAKVRAEASDTAHMDAVRRLEKTLENMDQGLFMVDEDGYLRVHNKRALDLLELPEEMFETPPHASEVLGFQAARGDFGTLSEDDKPKVHPSAVTDGLSTYERLTPNGRVIEIRSLPVDRGGIVRTYTDVTERRAADRALAEREALFRMLAEHATDIISRVKLDGTRLYDSPAVERVLGYSPEEMRSLVIRDQVHPDDLDAFGEIYATVKSGDSETAVGRFRFRHRDGRWVWIETRARRLRGEDIGAADEFIAVARDVTEQEEQAKALRLANEAAERNAKEAQSKSVEADRANRAKSDFLTSMSHELRTPLNAIIGFAQMLRLNNAGTLGETELEYAEFISKGGNHLLNLVNELLDLAGIESGKIKLSIEPVGVLDVVTQAVATMKPVARAKSVQIQVAELPVDGVVRVDAMRSKQIMLNLLSNAIKYNRTGGTVSVSATKLDSGIRIAVTDTGFGIPENYQAQLFEPFERLGAEFTAVEGTGIGLSLCKKLVESMEGKIGFSTVLGEGSTFWIDLPGVGSQGVQAEGLVAQGGSKRPVSNVQCSILYVEDNPANLRLMESLIGTIPGASLTTAPSGSLGLQMASSQTPDVIVLDLHLPGMSGLEVLNRLKSQASTWDIPVIALTAAAMPKDVARGLQAGFFRYLTKPLDVNAFITSIEDALRFHRDRTGTDDTSPQVRFLAGSSPGSGK